MSFFNTSGRFTLYCLPSWVHVICGNLTYRLSLLRNLLMFTSSPSPYIIFSLSVLGALFSSLRESRESSFTTTALIFAELEFSLDII